MAMTSSFGAPTFTVVIPATRPSSLPAAIRSIQEQQFESWEVVVVGQADDAAVRAALPPRAPSEPARLRYVHIPIAGLSRARNAGLLHARGDLIAMMDDDCEAAPNWLAVLSDAFERHPGVDFIGGSMLAPPKPAGRGFGRCPHWEAPALLYEPAASSYRIPPGFAFIGGDFAFRRLLAERVGPFDEHLGVGATFPAAEDTDYLLRMNALGVRILSTPRAIVSHSNGWRYGIAAVLRHQRQRGIGNGALAAKRTMAGDPTARKELDRLLLEFGRSALRLQRPAGFWYLPHFLLGYRRCLRGYRLNRAGLLCERAA